uniref:uncharacterized protein LOC109974601 n=1 Tax=Monopterus albus TaxID=43700 RepID=UPI0009B3E3B2|nr:uncharacterized protein LOC109974601 [Monopterus albus]
MAALTLLLSLTSGLVTMATAEQGLTCRQEIPTGLIRDLWNRTKVLINKLPKEENVSRRLRLLPKFCTKCPERVVGWLEMRELIDIYQRSVFSREVVQKLLPLHYNDLLYRLQHTLQRCVYSSKPSKWLKIITKLERKIKKELKEPEIGSNPLFRSVIRSISTSCQRKEQVQLMNATLDIYTHIFSSILQHSHHQHHDRTHVPALLDQLKEPKKSQVVSALTELRDKMEKLKKHLGRLDHQNLDQENVLSDLKKIMVDDPVDQRKALAQFREVYQAAAVVASRGCGSTR